MPNTNISIVIRTLNEAESLKKLLQSIRSQEGIDTNQVEIIVVDSESSDSTQEVAKQFGAKIVTISQEKFTYPKSMNLGVEAASSPIVVLTVGHALPVDSHWLASIVPYFEDDNVAGVYGSVLPNKNCGSFEALMYWRSYPKAKLFNPSRQHKIRGGGVFGATNCALRKSLWEEHHFDERYERGGEDTNWADWAFSQGYTIVREVGFTVRHSHGVSLLGLISEIRYWRSLSKPTKFSRAALSYRKDLKWDDKDNVT